MLTMSRIKNNVVFFIKQNKKLAKTANFVNPPTLYDKLSTTLRKVTETSVIEFSLPSKRNDITLELRNIEINTSSRARTV